MKKSNLGSTQQQVVTGIDIRNGLVYDTERDLFPLAEDTIYESDPHKTGLNNNIVVVGSTFSGKTMSINEPAMLHSYNRSIVGTFAKNGNRKAYKSLFEDRGYQIMDLDFSNPENSEYGFDPMEWIFGEEDINYLADSIVTPECKDTISTADPFWDDSAKSMIGAEIALEVIKAKEEGRKPSLVKLMEFHRSIRFKYADISSSNVDRLFEEAEAKYPGNPASMKWKSVSKLPEKTLSCTCSTLNTMLDKLVTKNVLALAGKKKKVDFVSIGTKKTFFAITSSPVNKSYQKYLNIMYGLMFKTLFETAEKNENGRLDVPVHIVCDDFACGSRIEHFEEYISIFRAAGISVTLLLQSESQLRSIYGNYAATTIINNCDTYVYFGGTDMDTCKSVSFRCNKPAQTVLTTPLEHIYVFRRGEQPILARRYQTLEDPMYKTYIQKKLPDHCNLKA